MQCKYDSGECFSVRGWHFSDFIKKSFTVRVLQDLTLKCCDLHFFQDNEKLKLIQAIMREVMTWRSSLVASKMTMEEAKETRQKVTTKMDFLNQSLGI